MWADSALKYCFAQAMLLNSSSGRHLYVCQLCPYLKLCLWLLHNTSSLEAATHMLQVWHTGSMTT